MEEISYKDYEQSSRMEFMKVYFRISKNLSDKTFSAYFLNHVCSEKLDMFTMGLQDFNYSMISERGSTFYN
jgi:hypothetical protein